MAPTQRWHPLDNPEPGYTIVIGVPWKLWGLLDVALLPLARARLVNCHGVILGIDATRDELIAHVGAPAVQRVQDQYAALQIRLLFYAPVQRRISRLLRWNWVDCWATWVMGLGACRTRYALLHDFDAVVVDPDVIEELYHVASEGEYRHAGVWKDDRLDDMGVPVLATFELMHDVAHLRQTYRPIDLFNRVRRLHGKRIECDICRDVQLRDGHRARLHHPIAEGRIIHPHQVISEWRKLKCSGRAYRPVGYTSLLFVPYFRCIAATGDELVSIVDALAARSDVVKVSDKSVDLGAINPAGWAWIAKQIERLNEYFGVAANSTPSRFAEVVAQRSGLVDDPPVAHKAPRVSEHANA